MICLNCTTYICSCGGNNSITLTFMNLLKETEDKIKKVDKEIKNNPLGAGFIQKDIKKMGENDT